MSNIIDYINWRKDFTFDEFPFNEVDALVLCQVQYNSFADLVAENFPLKSVRFKNVYENFYTKGNVNSRLHSNSMLSDETLSMIQLLGRSKRYSNIRLSGYTNVVDKEKGEQFSAITYSFFMKHKKVNYVVFRGTDDNLVGWKEDCWMSYRKVPAQEDAAVYLRKAMKCRWGKFFVGGHSKGGNLSIYAGTKLSGWQRLRLNQIYNFDGPGFSKEFLESDEYKNIRSKIHSWYPHQSVIGMLMYHDCEFTVVESQKHLLKQHHLLNWQVDAKGFVKCEQLSESSKFIAATMEQWIYGMSEEQKELFIESLFSIVDELDVSTSGDLSENKLKTVFGAVKSFSKMESQTRKVITECIRQLIKHARKNVSLLKKEK